MPQRYHAADYFSRTGMPLHVFTVQTAEHAMHDHDFSELVVVLSGRGLHITERERYPIEAGDVFVVHKNVRHAYHNVRDLKFTNVLFDSERLNLPVNDLLDLDGYHALFLLEPRVRSAGGAHHHCRLPPGELAVACELLESISQELKSRQPGYRGMAVGLFLQLVGFLSRSYMRINDPEPRSLMRLGRVLRLIEDKCTEPVTVEQLARQAAMSPSTLHRAFARSLRTSPIDYLIGLRVSKSLAWLRDSEETITEIAARCGFNDSNYFARQFRRRMGVTPRAFRKRAKRAACVAAGSERPDRQGGRSKGKKR